jgi:hypothetical protein
VTKKKTAPKKAKPPAVTTIERLRELGDWMRKMNCIQLELEEVTIILGPERAPATATDETPAPSAEAGGGGKGRRLVVPEGDILFASAGG